MAKIKFDVSGSDPKDAFKGGGLQPQPGIYSAKVLDVKIGHKRNEEPTEENKRLEVVVEIVNDKKFKGARLYDYIGQDTASEWKMDQFLQAAGVATARKRKGVFDTDDIIGETLKIRVTGDSYNNEYKGKLAAYLQSDPSEEEDEDEEEDEELEEELDDEEEIEEDEDEEEESEEDEEDVPPYDEWSITELKKEVADRGLSPKGTTKRALIAALEADDESEEGDEEEDEDDEEPF